MKKLILTLACLIIVPPLFAQSPTPPTSLRYGDLIPKDPDTNNIGHEGVKWETIYVNNVIVGDGSYAVALVPASAFGNGDATLTPDLMYYLFDDAAAQYLESVIFQWPLNFDQSRVINLSIGWMAYTNKTSTGKVRWEITFYQASHGEIFQIAGSAAYANNVANTGEDKLNRAEVTLNIGLSEDISSSDAIYVVIKRNALIAADTFNGGIARLLYVNLRVPITIQ